MSNFEIIETLAMNGLTQVDTTVSELVDDTRKFMQPNTASKLKEKK